MSPARRGGSRASVGRPRKLAGSRPEAPRGASEQDAAVVEEGAPAPVSKPPRAGGAGGFETGLRPSSTTGRPRRGRRTTRLLLAVCGVLAVVGVAEVFYLSRDREPTVSAARPVVTGALSHRAAVEAAARSTEQILSTSHEDYDAQVDQAAALTTGGFTEEYRELAAGVADRYAQQRMKLTVKAVARGVVQASEKEVQVLLFLNQYVEKVQDGEPATAVAQYRALVTVVRTDDGWRVAGIDTQ